MNTRDKGAFRRPLQSLASIVSGMGLLLLTTSASATLITATGSGGTVPENISSGATFDIEISESGTIGDVSLNLFNFRRYNPGYIQYLTSYGGVVEVVMRLTHVDTGTTATIINHPLNMASIICAAGMFGDYTFDSGASSTINQACGSGIVAVQPYYIWPGTFRPASDLSSIFDGESAAGIWRLFVSDTVVNTVPYQFTTNTDWNWGLAITTGAAPVPEPATLALFGLGLAGLAAVRRRKAA